MSMNLIWYDGKRFHDFGYQTSTDLTYEVLNAKTNDEKIKLVIQDLNSRYLNTEYSSFIEDIETEMRDNFRDGLTLEMI